MSPIPTYIFLNRSTLQHLTIPSISLPSRFPLHWPPNMVRLGIRLPHCEIGIQVDSVMMGIGRWVEFLVRSDSFSCPVRLVNFQLDANFGQTFREGEDLLFWAAWIGMWEYWVKTLDLNGIRFEDYLGNAIEVPLAFMEELEMIKEVAGHDDYERAIQRGWSFILLYR
jgi:hypothetical protein